MSKRKPPEFTKRKQFLAGHEEELFVHYYQTMGTARSFGKLASWCVSKGWINRQTGKPPTRMAPWFSMWRWAIKTENQEKAYKIYDNSLVDYGEHITRSEWEEFLDNKARVCLRPVDYDRWKEGQSVKV